MNMQVNRLSPQDYAARFAQPVSRKLQEDPSGSAARADQTKKAEETAKAGQSFLRENPAPDPKQGVVMSLQSAKEEGSVRRVELPKQQEPGVKEAKATEKPEAAEQKPQRDTVEAVMERRDEKKAEDAEKKAEEAKKSEPGAQPKTSREAVEEEQANRVERKEAEATNEANPAKQPATSREAVEAAGRKEGAEQNAPQTIDLGVRNATMSLDRMRDEMQQRQAQQAVNPLAAA